MKIWTKKETFLYLFSSTIYINIFFSGEYKEKICRIAMTFCCWIFANEKIVWKYLIMRRLLNCFLGKVIKFLSDLILISLAVTATGCSRFKCSQMDTLQISELGLYQKFWIFEGHCLFYRIQVSSLTRFRTFILKNRINRQ